MAGQPSGPDSWYGRRRPRRAVNTAMPTRLCVPCRCPPEIRATIQANASVRKPKHRAIVLSGWSMSGSTPAPAVSATPTTRCGPVTCSHGPSAANDERAAQRVIPAKHSDLSGTT